jgi:uncharacterized membrane protein YjfL (UPF0719 family)
LEELFLIVGLVFALPVWGGWYVDLLRVRPLRSKLVLRILMLLAPLACIAILLFILMRHASWDVRESEYYITVYTIAGIGWTALVSYSYPYLGLDMRGDVLERNNPAAAIVLVGALLGTMLCFAGGNIGDGPGVDAVILSAGLSTLGFLGLWAGLEYLTRLSELVTIERDAGAGVRLCCWLVAVGLVLGRAVAGNWLSIENTLSDFVLVGWFAIVIWLLAFMTERFIFRNRSVRSASPDAPNASSVMLASLFVGAAHIVVALFWIEQAGPWQVQ